MVVNLPTDLLRSFAAIVDAGSMARAAERVYVTQSALSLQMKRLADLVQNPLFNREGRRLSLTPAGENMLGHAREILAANDRAVLALSGDRLIGPARLGIVQDFAEILLSRVLAQFAQGHPDTPLQVQVGHSAELAERMEAGQIDVLLSLGSPDNKAAIRTAHAAWFGEADLFGENVLPLVVLERPCLFREAALKVLEETGRPYRIVLETPNLAALKTAVLSGLGITSRTTHFMDAAAPKHGALPKLPKIAYIRQVKANSHPVISELGELVRAAALQLY